jgi:hypothetical protein
MKIEQTHGLPNPRLYEIFKGMISRREKPMSHTVKRCKFLAFFGVSLDDSVVGIKMMHPKEVGFSEKVVHPLRWKV